MKKLLCQGVKLSSGHMQHLHSLLPVCHLHVMLPDITNCQKWACDTQVRLAGVFYS